MFDAHTLNLIAPVKIVDNYSGGKYVVYSYNKSVKFRLINVRGGFVTLSGIFFDEKKQHDLQGQSGKSLNINH